MAKKQSGLKVGQRVTLEGTIVKTFEEYGEQWAIFKTETYPLPITLKASRFEPAREDA